MDRATIEMTSAAVRRSGRIAALRECVLSHKDSAEVGFLIWNGVVTARSLRASENVASWQIRRGLLTRDR